MNVFRISSEKYIRDLSGTGSRLYGGRWNSKGVSMLYTSMSSSLAAWEVLVHVNVVSFPSDLQLATIQIPDKLITEMGEEGLPKDWRASFHNEALRAIGDNYIKKMDALGMKVPSVPFPKEYNVLVNPMHPKASEIRLINVEPFYFDPRIEKLAGQ